MVLNFVTHSKNCHLDFLNELCWLLVAELRVVNFGPANFI